MTDGENVRGAELEREARSKLDDYLRWVRKDLKEVDGAEKKAMLEEIEGALLEKSAILAAETKAAMVDGAMMDRALDEFGSPSEVAKEYAGVAKVALGWDLKLFMLLQAVFAGAMGIIGAMPIWDNQQMIEAGYEIVPNGIIWGCFWISLTTFTLVSLGIQYKKRELIPVLGPFTSLALFASGLWGIMTISIYRWQVDWIFGLEDYYQQEALLVILTLTLVLAFIWGFTRLLKFTRKLRATESGELVPGRRRFSRKSKIFKMIASIVLMALFVSGSYSAYVYPNPPFFPQKGKEELITSEYIGGPYNATLQKIDYFDGGQWWDGNRIVYNVSGKEVKGWFGLETVKAMDWIKDNTPENATIVAWWDHGISIRGYTGRNCTIYYPSKNLVNTVYDPSTIEGWEPKEKVRQTAEIYMAENGAQLKAGMDVVGAHYIFITWRYSSSIAFALLQGAGKDESRYLDKNVMNTQGRYLPTAAGESLFLFKIWKSGFEGANIVYRDIDNLVVEVP